MQNKVTNWYKLDNAAKVYPPLSAKDKYDIYCLSFIMKEPVQPKKLQQAVNQVLNRFACYKVKLKRGFFWYYLENNDKEYIVKKESKSTFLPIDANENNGYIFNITYLSNKITMGMSHILTDGIGCLNFFKAIIFRYLQLCGKNITNNKNIIEITTPVQEGEISDDYKTYYNHDADKLEKEDKSYIIKGTTNPEKRYNHFVLRMPTEQLIALAKKYNATITAFLSALIAYSIYKGQVENQKARNKTIKVFVPVNLRNLFPSVTMNNFVGYFRTSHDFKNPVSFEELLEITKSQMQNKITKEYLNSSFGSNVELERNVFLRLAPLFIKDLALKVGYNLLSDALHTASLSNLGNADLPEEMNEYVDSIVFYASAEKKGQFNVNMISACGVTNISLAKYYQETEIEQYFIKFLTDNKINLTYIS